MKLPLDLYGTDAQAALGVWVLLEATIAPPQLAPFADPNPRAKARSGRLSSPNASHTDIHRPLMRLLGLFQYCTHDVIYSIYMYRAVKRVYWYVNNHCSTMYFLASKDISEFSGTWRDTGRCGLGACRHSLRGLGKRGAKTRENVAKPWIRHRSTTYVRHAIGINHWDLQIVR